MKDTTILDIDNTYDIDNQLRADRRKYLIVIVILVVTNTLLFGLFVKGPRSMAEHFSAALYANIIGVNVLGFMLGTILALFPYKGLTYKKKYLRASLLVILTIQVLIFIGVSLNCMMYLI